MDSTTPQTSQVASSPPANPATAPASGPRRGSGLRLGILLLVLAACIAALAYDHYIAKPSSAEAYDKIHKFVDGRQRLSIKEGGTITSDAIQKELGRSPTWVEKEPTYTVEWYCWWGPTPVFSTRRHYVTVLYVGEERRFSTHQLNGPPAEEDLPTYVMKHVPADAASEEGPVAGAEPPPMAMPGMGPGMGKGKGGKGRGKGKGGPGSPPTEAPAPEENASAPTESAPPDNKPAESAPAESSDKPKSDGDAPAADKPATDEPATTEKAPEGEKAPE